CVIRKRREPALRDPRAPHDGRDLVGHIEEFAGRGGAKGECLGPEGESPGSANPCAGMVVGLIEQAEGRIGRVTHSSSAPLARHTCAVACTSDAAPGTLRRPLQTAGACYRLVARTLSKQSLQ